MSDASDIRERLSRDELSRQLDGALEQTFPASDPVSIGEPTGIEPDRPVGRKPAALDTALIEELAKQVESRHLGHPQS